MVKFDTVFNEKAVFKAMKINMIRLKPLYITLSVLFILISIAFFDAGEIKLGIFYLLVFGVGFYPLCLGLGLLFQKSLNSTDRTISERSNIHFEFLEDKVIVNYKKGDELVEHSEIMYHIFFRAVETKDAFLLSISRAKCYLLEKNKITEGTCAELRDILKKNMGSRFKVLCK